MTMRSRKVKQAWAVVLVPKQGPPRIWDWLQFESGDDGRLAVFETKARAKRFIREQQERYYAAFQAVNERAKEYGEAVFWTEEKVAAHLTWYLAKVETTIVSAVPPRKK